MENTIKFPQNLKVDLLYDLANPLLHVYLKKMKTLIRKDTRTPTFIATRFTLPKTFNSVQFSHSVMSDSLTPHGLQPTRLPCPTLKICPSSWWCSPTISSSVDPLFFCLQSLPASGSFPMSLFFASGGQSIVVSASASVLPLNIQDWLPLGWTGWISLQSKGLSRVLFQHHSSKASILRHLVFFTV